MGKMLVETGNCRVLDKEHAAYLQSLIQYLREPSRMLREKVGKKAKDADTTHKNCYGLRTYFSKGLRSRLTKLQCEERREWAVLLYANFENEYRNDLKAISPFKDSALFVVDYGSNLPQMRDENNDYLHAEAEGSFKEAIERRGWETYNGNIYLIVCDSPLLSNGETFLVYGC